MDSAKKRASVFQAKTVQALNNSGGYRLQIFGGKCKGKSGKPVVDGLAEKHRPEFYGGEEDLRVLGDDTFMEKCLAGSGGRPLRLTINDIASAVCLAYNLDESVLKIRSQQRTLAEARAMIGWLAYESGCVTLSEVGRYVNRDVGSISSAVRRLSERFQDRPELADRAKTLKTLLGKQT